MPRKLLSHPYEKGCAEAWAYRTDVLQSVTGAEQRISLLEYPDEILGITIASPLDTSPRSVFRLFRKIHGYLEAIGSAEYSRKHGKATPENTLIEVNFTAGAAGTGLAHLPEVLFLTKAPNPFGR